MMRAMVSSTRLLPIAVVARQLFVPVTWLREECEAGRIPCLKAGRRILVDAQLVESLLIERATAGRREAGKHE